MSGDDGVQYTYQVNTGTVLSAPAVIRAHNIDRSVFVAERGENGAASHLGLMGFSLKGKIAMCMGVQEFGVRMY